MDRTSSRNGVNEKCSQDLAAKHECKMGRQYIQMESKKTGWKGVDKIDFAQEGSGVGPL
jgi:hypothetical protein